MELFHHVHPISSCYLGHNHGLPKVPFARDASRHLSAHRGAVTGRSAAGRRAHAGHGLAGTCAGAHQAADAWFFQKNGASRPRKDLLMGIAGNFGISMGISMEVGMILGECEV